jgi:hypothetical protein
MQGLLAFRDSMDVRDIAAVAALALARNSEGKSYALTARILRNFIGGRTSGFLFQTANRTMLDPGNIAGDSLNPILEDMGRNEVGTRFNVFRRFREAVLQRSETRQILIDYWMGHSNPSMGDRYGKQLVEDVEYRQEQVKKVGLGFDLPPSLFGLLGLQNEGSDHKKEAA